MKKNKIKTKIIILFGSPGVGKGSFAELIRQDFHFYKSTPGDILRKYASDSKLFR